MANSRTTVKRKDTATGKPKGKAPKLTFKFLPDCNLGSLKVYDRNPRLNDPAVEAVSRSIAAFGFISPIIVDEEYRICAGHTRYKAATALGLTTVPVLMVPGLSGDKFAGFNIADNRTGQIAEWDQEELARIVAELKEHDFDLSSLGFNDDEIKDLLSQLNGPDFDPASIEEQGKLDRKVPDLMPLDDEMRVQVTSLSKPYPKRVGSICGDARGVQPCQGGSNPTPTLQEAAHA